MRRNNRSSLAALAVVAALGLGACATTIEGDTAATSTAPASTTTTIPRGTVAELFGSILGIGASLGNDIASGEMATARAKLADIRATWQAITPQIADLGSDQADDLRRLIGLYETAVERKRPADADKATRFLQLAIEPLLAAG
ncbi:MAG: hypothetical protein EBU67_00895 [Actinobacteria bacterium]|jgi:hypothetical protein|nr:hypothetical protein [Actinomycetota bacterium]NBP52855.1 hypothetical protein [Actinomycetota bacterium]